MDEYVFEDALANSTVTCTYPGLEAVRVAAAPDAAPDGATSLFFPGCSFINYALPLVQSVYDLLHDAGEVDGISLLCCGKILEYEGDGGASRTAFEGQFREHIANTQVKRIVAACPNCVYALRRLLAADEATSAIEVVPLPKVLGDLGYAVDPDVATGVVRRRREALGMAMPADANAAGSESFAAGGQAVFCPKDSCPDRATGEFADGLRAIMANTQLVEPKYARKRSYCCGSRPRAMGHYDLGDKMARRHGAHAREAGADALVTACVSCAFSLYGSGCEVPVFHYLELLFDWDIPWHLAEGYMKLRFLFEDADAGRDVRGYKGLEA